MLITALAGWLFADMFLALAVIMLGSSPTPPPTTTTTTTTTTSSTTTTTSTTVPGGVEPKGLSTTPVCVFVTVDRSALLASDLLAPEGSGVRDAVLNSIREQIQPQLATSQRAGLVLMWGVAPEVGLGKSTALAVQGLLPFADLNMFGTRSDRSPVQVRPLWSGKPDIEVCPAPLDPGGTVAVAEIYFLT